MSRPGSLNMSELKRAARHIQTIAEMTERIARLEAAIAQMAARLQRLEAANGARDPRQAEGDAYDPAALIG